MNATTEKPFELARKNDDGSWDLIGDFGTRDDALAAAKDAGSGTYGLSHDPASGHYETTIIVADDGEATIN